MTRGYRGVEVDVPTSGVGVAALDPLVAGSRLGDRPRRLADLTAEHSAAQRVPGGAGEADRGERGTARAGGQQRPPRDRLGHEAIMPSGTR